jgi:hypothetical protein
MNIRTDRSRVAGLALSRAIGRTIPSSTESRSLRDMSGVPGPRGRASTTSRLQAEASLTFATRGASARSTRLPSVCPPPCPLPAVRRTRLSRNQRTAVAVPRKSPA